jgi:hypothetical protein
MLIHLGTTAEAEVCGVQIEKDAAYIKAVEAAGTRVENVIKANNAIDIYQDYFDHGSATPLSQSVDLLFKACGVGLLAYVRNELFLIQEPL